MFARVVVGLLVLVMTSAGCGDGRSPSGEAFCGDLANLRSVGSRLDAVVNGDTENLAPVMAQLSAALESAQRHAPDPVHEHVVTIRQRWEDAKAGVEGGDLDLGEGMPQSSARDLNDALSVVADRLDGPIASWEEANC